MCKTCHLNMLAIALPAGYMMHLSKFTTNNYFDIHIKTIGITSVAWQRRCHLILSNINFGYIFPGATLRNVIFMRLLESEARLYMANTNRCTRHLCCLKNYPHSIMKNSYTDIVAWFHQMQHIKHIQNFKN